MRSLGVSVPKVKEQQTNEDSIRFDSTLIAVSDGAGGGGVYADRWARYLLENLPKEPITTADELDQWLDGIWEPFYNSCEEDAKKDGGLLLSKFYKEGSFATLVAVWIDSGNKCRWMSYGDSVAFHFNSKNGILEHSFTKLSDFDNPPHLINCKDPINDSAFRSGVFEIDKGSVIFVASDALSHYILMMYEVANQSKYAEELSAALNSHSKNVAPIKLALSQKVFFETKVLNKLCNVCQSEKQFSDYIAAKLKKGLLLNDDMSFAFVKF